MHSTPGRTIPADPQASTSTVDTARATIDVWRASLDRPDAEVVHLARYLDADEARRSANFRARRDRCRFQAAHGVLRQILSHYLDMAPERIGLGYGAQGKPFVAEYPEVQFNLSHTDDVLVVGVARGRRLGIDVEQLIPEAVMNEVMGTVSSDPERALLGGLPASARRERFMRLWTRKEAYIKADGRGMTLDLKRVDVLSLTKRVRLLEEDAPGWTPCPEWTVQDLAMGSGLAAALVAEGADWRTAHFEWPADGR